MIHIDIGGAIQGVGFRPFIFRLAKELDLHGYVRNTSGGVTIEAEGEENILIEFLIRIKKEKPPLAVITSLEYIFLDPAGYTGFDIRESGRTEDISAMILPDISTCPDCLKELFDPADRRYLYPFINCTYCGPRFTIIENLPYDRVNTSMKKFEMCNECRREYHDPFNRRFHAQPNACPKCGPRLQLWDPDGKILAERRYALSESAEKIRNGKIVALKGVGGFQLIVDAGNDDAIKRLRILKHRDEKPFAVMFPSLKEVKEICELSALEERVLVSPESPIVILHRNNLETNLISLLCAPENPNLGIMLPYSPLHHLLMRMLNFPVVATSGNLSEETICIDEYEAVERLKRTADYFLVHDRPIVRHADDSIIRVAANREMVLRRARGFAPLPVPIPKEIQDNDPLIALGGHLKNTVAIKIKDNIFISQHIGDLTTSESYRAFKDVIKDFQNLYALKADKILCDLHPDYFSAKYAEQSGILNEKIQHHIAHIAACRIENQIRGEALGVSWDGTGYGLDKTLWGGEFFVSDDFSSRHLGQFRKFPLAGGDSAVKEPRRSALGILYELSNGNSLNIYKDILLNIFSPAEFKLLLKMLENRINSHLTSSAGRLFDAVSSLLMLKQYSSFEGQAAMQLEFAADKCTRDFYLFDILEGQTAVVDWQKIFETLLEDIKGKIPTAVIASKFHNTLAEIICAMAERFSLRKVILSGGCFQNVVLLERTVERLRKKSIKAYWHQRIPPNDGGISAGQIAEYLKRKKHQRKSAGENLNIENPALNVSASAS